MSAERETRWGFHQLADQWAARIVRASLLRPGDLVLDIGAGTGALTAHLIAAGARVIAIEAHPDRAGILRTRFGSQITVVQADAADLRLPRRAFRVVANPPFGIATGLLRRLVSPGSRLVSAEVVLPAFMAARWAGGRAPSTRRWSQTYRVGTTLRLPARAFRPPAPMPTAVLRIERRPDGSAHPHAPPTPTIVKPRRRVAQWSDSTWASCLGVIGG